jgi:hypothetical protein
VPFTVTVDWGAGQTPSSFRFSAYDVNEEPGGPSNFVASHYYDDAGGSFPSTFAVSATILTDDGRSIESALTINGVRAPPTPIITSITSLVHVGDSVTASAIVNDPGENETFTYSWQALLPDGTVAHSGSGTNFTFPTDASDEAGLFASLQVTNAEGIAYPPIGDGVYVDPDFSLTCNYVDAHGSTEASVSVHLAIADISFVDVNGSTLSAIVPDEDIPSDLPPPTDSGSLAEVYQSLDLVEYRTQIAGLHSGQIQQVTVRSDAGDQYQDTMTDTASGSESALFGIVADNGGQALSSAQQSAIRSAFNVNALDADYLVAQVQTPKDNQQRKVAVAPQKEVFAFEGYGGFPKGWKEGNDNPPVLKNGFPATRGRTSDSQVVNWWRAAAKAAGPSVAWHYYSQDAAGVTAAEQQIKAIATMPHGGVYDTITILGYSNGGDAALEVAAWLKTQSITVDLAITCDPVPKSVNILTHPWSVGGAMTTACPTNVTNWYNFYQQFDTDSLRAVNWLHIPGGLPTNIWGRTVTGATANTQIVPNDFQADPLIGGIPIGAATTQAHVLIPMLSVVQKKITDEIKGLPQSKGSFSPP